jgi:hypothetical protein
MAKRYPDIGVCIYCGAGSYAPDSKRFLALEHIIPEGLSGDLELPQASCRACERAINPWETRLLKGNFLGARTFLGLETKRPKDRPQKLPLFDSSVKPERKVMVAIADYPFSMMMTQLPEPCALSGLPPQFAAETIWAHFSPHRIVNYYPENMGCVHSELPHSIRRLCM